MQTSTGERPLLALSSNASTSTICSPIQGYRPVSALLSSFEGNQQQCKADSRGAGSAIARHVLHLVVI